VPRDIFNPNSDILGSVFSGNSADDTSAISAGTGSALPAVIGANLSPATPGQIPYIRRDGTWGVETPNVTIDITRPPYNAIGDGSYHALSERYATLSAAQVDYPFATALSDQIDWCALQKAVNDANTAGGGVIFCKRKTFILQKQIQWASRVHLVGVSDARTFTQGTSVGTVFTNVSNVLVGTTATANTTNTSTTLSSISNFTDLKPDTPISGTGIRVGTYIVSVNSGAGTAVMSHPATATNSGVTITPGKAMFNTAACVNYGFHRVSFVQSGVFGANTAMAISDYEGQGTAVAGLGTIDGCYFTNFGGPAIGLYGNVMFILRNRGDQLGGTFIKIANSGSVCVGSDGFIAYNSTGYTYGNGSSPGATGDGIHLAGGAYYAIIGNAMYNCQNGINLSNSSTNRVVGNRCEKNDQNGIALQGSGTVENSIVGNICFNNGYVSAAAGVNLFNSASRNVISNNVLYNDIFASGPSFTADISSGSPNLANVSSFANLVAGMRIIGTGIPAGTYVQSINSGANTAVLTANASATTTGVTLTTLPTNNGISLSGAANTNVVSNNYVYDVNTAGISVSSASYNTIDGNQVNNCGTQGIAISGTTPTGNTVENNSVYNASQLLTNSVDGIWLNTAVNTLVSGNSVWGPATAKVRYGVGIESGASGAHVIGNYAVGGNYVSGAFNNLGSGTIVRNFRGYTVGAITVAVPATTVAVAAVAYDRWFYVTAGTGGVTLAFSNGANSITIAAGATVPVFLPGAVTMTPTYTNAPTWVAHGYGD
jgi:parallel beta-helix repeat protein